MVPLYREHIGTLETVLYIEVVFNSEVIEDRTSVLCMAVIIQCVFLHYYRDICLQ